MPTRAKKKARDFATASGPRFAASTFPKKGAKSLCAGRDRGTNGAETYRTGTETSILGAVMDGPSPGDVHFFDISLWPT